MGRAKFIALQDQIAAELARGLFKKAVYSQFEARLGISYRQFLYYVQEFDIGFKRQDKKRAVTAFAGRAQPLEKAPSRDDQERVLTRPARAPIYKKPERPQHFVRNPEGIDPKKLA